MALDLEYQTDCRRLVVVVVSVVVVVWVVSLTALALAYWVLSSVCCCSSFLPFQDWIDLDNSRSGQRGHIIRNLGHRGSVDSKS